MTTLLKKTIPNERVGVKIARAITEANREAIYDKIMSLAVYDIEDEDVYLNLCDKAVIMARVEESIRGYVL